MTMSANGLRIVRYLRLNESVSAVAISENGLHILTGAERSLSLFTREGERLFRYALPKTADPTRSLPFIETVLAPGGERGLAIQRSGEFLRLDLRPLSDSEAWSPVEIEEFWRTGSDVYTIDYWPDEDLIGVGHFSEAITLLDTEGRVHWRQTTKGRTWAVTFGPRGDALYVGSSDAPPFRLAGLSVEQGSVRTGRLVQERVMALASLPAPLAIAAVHRGEWASYLQAYTPDLQEAWRFECDFGEYITAMASHVDADILALGFNTGQITILQASTGQVWAQDFLASVVLSLDASGDQHLVAGLQDGHAAILFFTPPSVQNAFDL